ncbi:helix-turn-helix domain-containing protein [Jiulongibacter sp. NS-SX5]|uniref:helix-turn-helix domain-containing protein n=1 Tax=Jiulongibacter sp. NS-SX5 TaxID=3463854 RepID=UPI004057DC40
MIFIGPGQVITNEPEGELHQPYGKAIVFHPDLLHKTSLASQMVNYNFFSYQSNEALHLSDRERGMVEACFENVKVEIIQNIDKHSKQLILANIELLLKYCTRFYERQFITREHVNDGLLLNFENHLKVYFGSDQLKNYGIPSVVYFAEKLNLSPNYFGDLVKKETGKSPLEFIHLKLMEMAKIKVMDTSKSISDISFELGFKYPQHFTRFFKQHTGQSPKEYRTV